MGKHNLESKSFSQWQPSIINRGERRHAHFNINVNAESSVATADKTERFARDLGTETINAAFSAIVENFEVKRPSFKERLQKIGNGVLRLVKSVRFEYPETQKLLYTAAEKHALFEADREHARAKARETVASFFEPHSTQNGPMVVEGRVEHVTPALTREQEDDLITSYWLNKQDGVSYEQQTAYARARQQEEASLQNDSKSTRIRLLTHDGPTATAPLIPHEEFVANFQEVARARYEADLAYYKATNTPQDKYGRFMPEDELVGATH